MSNSPQTIILHRFYLIYGIGALILYGFLMVFVFPWWNACNHPVIVKIDASANTLMELKFEDAGYLPLAPMGEEGTRYRKWGTELPPRPDYTLSLRFPEGTVNPVVLSEVSVMTLSPHKTSTLLNLGMLETRPSEGIKVVNGPKGWAITAQPGGEILLVDHFSHTGIKDWVLAAGSATLGFILVSGMVLMLLASGMRFPDRIQAKEHDIPRRESVFLLGGILLGSLIHLHLVGCSIPAYWPADSTSYTMKAVSLAAQGSYDTGTQEYELNRMPGFPAFMALVFRVAGWNLKAVTWAQGFCFCFSILALALSLRRFVSGHLLGIGAFLALVSPAAVWASRQIATESTFSSSWMLALAAFIYLWQCKGMQRWIGWVLFGLAATAAVAIRPNGILLFVLPGLLSLGTLWWAVSIQGWDFWRLRILWMTAVQVVIPCVMVLLFIFAWSWRNYESRGYPKPTDLTEVVWANAPFFAGIFDIRAAKDPEEYKWFVNERANSGYWFHGWSLRKYRFRKITNEYQQIEDRSIGELEEELADFNAKSNALIPFRAKLVGWGRVSGWGLFLPRIGAHTTDPLNQRYEVTTGFPNEKNEAQVRKNLKWATRNVEKEIQLMVAEPDSWIDRYNNTVAVLYPWVYRILFLGALVGWSCALAERKYLVVALVIPFLANIFLNIYFMYIIGRYVQVLDASLWFALVAGLACLSAGDQQKPVNESDRQCMPSIKPKRLLTRFANTTGTTP